VASAPSVDPYAIHPYISPSPAAPPPASRAPVSLLGGLTGLISGFATGGIGGAIVGGVAGFSGGGSPGTAVVPTQSGGGGSIFGNQTMPFGLPTVGQVTGTGWGTPAAGGTCPKGYHLNKHPLAASKHHGAAPARSMCVRNRHMHALNSKAITRSLRRIKRAGKIVRKLHAFSGTRRLAASSSSRGGHRAGCGCVVCRRR